MAEDWYDQAKNFDPSQAYEVKLTKFLMKQASEYLDKYIKAEDA